jgi:hypothetical protein
MTGITVKYRGAQRKMKIPVNVVQGFKSDGRPAGDGGMKKRTNFTTIIPDGYEIDIQVTPLVKETQNFLYHTTTENESIYDIKIRE